MLKLQTELDYKVTQDKNTVYSHFTAKDCLEMFEKLYRMSDSELIEELPTNGSVLIEKRNGSYGTMFGKGNSFSGITAEELIEWNNGKNIDLKPFLEEKKKLGELSRKLKEKLAPIGKARRRRLSETDGEWDLDRKWDLKPFLATEKQNNSILPTIRVDIDFCFSGGHDSSAISRFGAFCWAIFSEIEEAGITCEVNLLQYCERAFLTSYKKMFQTQTLKKAGEYIDSASLARCFTSGHYRRAAFVAEVYTAECAGVRVSPGLGCPIPQPTESEPGKLRLSISNQTLQIDSLLKKVLQAIGAGE